MSTHETPVTLAKDDTQHTSASSGSVEQHSIKLSAFLHLAPGVLILLFYVALAPIAMGLGYPPILAIMIGNVFILLFFELGDLLWQGRRRNGKWSLEGIVLNREPMSLRRYLLWVPLIVVFAFLVYTLASPLDLLLITLMSGLPNWFVLSDISQLAAYPRQSLVLTFWVVMAVNGVLAPIIEEMYFRGYLMPRLARFGRWTPVIHHLLFTIYHFWQPYLYGTIFFGVLPLTAAVWWKRNIKLGILTHMALNIIGGLLNFGQLLG
jgi:membrane protease YdiL (CAAX protease family)